MESTGCAMAAGSNNDTCFRRFCILTRSSSTKIVQLLDKLSANCSFMMRTTRRQNIGWTNRLPTLLPNLSESRYNSPDRLILLPIIGGRRRTKKCEFPPKLSARPSVLAKHTRHRPARDRIVRFLQVAGGSRFLGHE